MSAVCHPTTDELQRGLHHVRESPAVEGVLELIVRRPAIDAREVCAAGELSIETGLVGDGWLARGSRHTIDGSAEPDRQLTVMNVRSIELLAGDDRTRWPLAGDQLYVDLDLSATNLPTGSRVKIGGAVVEVTAPPHTGCAKFSRRFGADALRFVNSPEGSVLRLRGLNARVVEGGPITTGDAVVKLAR